MVKTDIFSCFARTVPSSTGMIYTTTVCWVRCYDTYRNQEVRNNYLICVNMKSGDEQEKLSIRGRQLEKGLKIGKSGGS